MWGSEVIPGLSLPLPQCLSSQLEVLIHRSPTFITLSLPAEYQSKGVAASLGQQSSRGSSKSSAGSAAAAGAAGGAAAGGSAASAAVRSVEELRSQLQQRLQQLKDLKSEKETLKVSGVTLG